MKKLISKKGFSSGASTIISLSLVLFVVGLLAFVLINAKKVSDKMKESIVFTIMLQNNSENESVKISENKRLEWVGAVSGGDNGTQNRFPNSLSLPPPPPPPQYSFNLI